MLVVKIPVGGVFHGGRSGAQAGQKGHRQGRQDENGQKAAQRLPDFPEGVCQNRAAAGPVSRQSGPLLSVKSRYHSISSTGVGWGLYSEASTRPLLMWITRSAMGVMAVLWVMTTTVMPRRRQVSWSSLRMDFPVT